MQVKPVHYQYINLTIYVVLNASPKIYNVVILNNFLSPRQIVENFIKWIEKNVT